MFNLNDRGTMAYPMLVGQNILEAGGFMIDPTINDPDDPDGIDEDFEIDWESLQEELKDDDVSDFITESKNDLVEKVINLIKGETT
jgi:hypothetical protein